MDLNFSRRLFHLCVRSKNGSVEHDQVSHFLNKDHLSLLILNILDNNHKLRLTMKIICKQVRAERERFRKRRKGLFKKADELSILCHADLYLVIYQGGSYYTYSSTKRQGWPPSENDLVRELCRMRI